MKQMILNSSGNCGKSTITGLIAPLMEDTQIIEVETVNKGNSEVKSLNVFKFKAGDNFEKLYENLMMNENVIIDIGASNLGNFWEQLAEYGSITDLIDRFIIPTTGDEKIQTDTAKVVNFLLSQDIEKDKIKVLFNRTNDVKTDFGMLIKALKSLGLTVDETIYLKDTQIFKELGFLRKTLDEVYHQDIKHYTALMLSEKDKQKKGVFLKSDLINRMAHKIKDDVDYIFEALTGMKPIKTETVSSTEEIKEEDSNEEPSETETEEDF